MIFRDDLRRRCRRWHLIPISQVALWVRFREVEAGASVNYLKALVTDISSLIGGGNQTGAVVESVEAELLNMDIRLIRGKSLPDTTELRRCSHLQGPKVLQISSVRDVTRSSAEEFLGSSNGKRVLKIALTDGKTEISALEYSHIPSINNDVTPGTKVRLENKAVIRDGLVCLTPKEVTLFEELQIRTDCRTYILWRSCLKQEDHTLSLLDMYAQRLDERSFW